MSGQNGPVRRERDGTLGRIVLARPEARNPLDSGMSAGILEALEHHLADPEVRSVVVQAEGPAFCAGADLDQVKTLPDASATIAFGWPDAIVQAHRLMLRSPKPVIAAVDGPAYAGGLGLAGMCDVIIATERARFATPESKIGLFPMIIVAHLSRSLPRKVLLDMMLSGRPISAERAHEIGFVNRLVPGPVELEDAVQDYARAFDVVSPDAIALGRRAFNLLSDMPADMSLDAAQFLNVSFLLSEPFREGAGAFLQKRSPHWAEPTPASANPKE